MFSLHRTVSVQKFHLFWWLDEMQHCRQRTTASDAEFCIRFFRLLFLLDSFLLASAMPILILRLRSEAVSVNVYSCIDMKGRFICFIGVKLHVDTYLQHHSAGVVSVVCAPWCRLLFLLFQEHLIRALR